MTGSDYPIIQAPMGWIARAQLAAAVSNADGLVVEGGDMEVAIPLSGKVVGRIDEVKSAADIVQGTVNGFYEAVSGLSAHCSE